MTGADLGHLGSEWPFSPTPRAVQSLERELGSPIGSFERRRYDAAIARVARGDFETHVTAGGELEQAAAVEYALSHHEAR